MYWHCLKLLYILTNITWLNIILKFVTNMFTFWHRGYCPVFTALYLSLPHQTRYVIQLKLPQYKNENKNHSFLWYFKESWCLHASLPQSHNQKICFQSRETLHHQVRIPVSHSIALFLIWYQDDNLPWKLMKIA